MKWLGYPDVYPDKLHKWPSFQKAKAFVLDLLEKGDKSAEAEL